MPAVSATHLKSVPLEERIETERHDFTQSAVAVGRHMLQLESGYSYLYKDTDDELGSAHTALEMLLRVGLSEDLEFRLRWNCTWIFFENEPGKNGSEELRYSLKFQMTRETCGGYLPTSVLELGGSASTGGGDFTTERVGFSFDYICKRELAEGVTLAGSTGLRR